MPVDLKKTSDAGLIALAVSASPLLLGARLRQSVIGRMFIAVNPFSAAAGAYDSVIMISAALVML